MGKESVLSTYPAAITRRTARMCDVARETDKAALSRLTSSREFSKSSLHKARRNSASYLFAEFSKISVFSSSFFDHEAGGVLCFVSVAGDRNEVATAGRD